MILVVVMKEEVGEERLNEAFIKTHKEWNEFLVRLQALSLIWLERTSHGNSYPESSHQVKCLQGSKLKSQSSSQEGEECEGASGGINCTPYVKRSALCLPKGPLLCGPRKEYSDPDFEEVSCPKVVLSSPLKLNVCTVRIGVNGALDELPKPQTDG